MLILLVTPLASMAARPVYDLSLGFSHDDNVSRAAHAADIRAENLLTLAAAATWQYRLGDRSGFIASARTRFEGHERFGALSNIGLGGFVAYRFKPVRGYTAPWFSIEGTLGVRQHNDSDIRDSLLSSLGLVAGKRFTDRIRARGGFAYHRRTAFNDEVFDNRRRRVFLDLDYRPRANLGFHGRYSYAWGDVVSNSRPNPRIGAAAEVIVPDDAFDRACGPGAARASGYCAYRLDGASHSFRLAGTYRVSQGMSLEINARYLEVLGKLGNDYNSLQAGVRVLFRIK